MKERQITIFLWNVNGIRAAECTGFLAWAQANGADIVALRATQAHPEQLTTVVRKPDYQVDWCAAEIKRSSGVATFSRIAPLAVAGGLDDPRFDSEGRVLISTFAPFERFTISFPNDGRGRSG